MTAITSCRDRCHNSSTRNNRRSGRAEQFCRRTGSDLPTGGARVDLSSINSCKILFGKAEVLLQEGVRLSRNIIAPFSRRLFRPAFERTKAEAS
jgi:hypothetical protein